MEGEFANWMAIKFQHNAQQEENFSLNVGLLFPVNVDFVSIIMITQIRMGKKIRYVYIKGKKQSSLH